jgi:uncharacterized protein (DUF1786 family)
MSRVLTVDIGAGTMDVLYYDTKSGVHYKTVVKSPVACIAERAANIEGKLLIVGSEMGGGAVSRVLKERAAKTEVVMSASAAATVHHSLDRVRSFGIKVVEDQVAEKMRQSNEYVTLMSCDLEIERLKQIVAGFDVPFFFDIMGVCAQDHGVAPDGVSHLDYRHNNFKAILDKNPFPHALLYKDDEVPENMNRLRSISGSAMMLPADEIYVMDSGMAAILGACMDPRVKGKRNVLVMDIATSHTIGAALQDGELDGFFEYHTSDITLERLETLLRELADGKLEHKQILSEGGHGAYTRKAFGFENADIIVATGPKRKLLEKSRLSIIPGAPLGDNMMTGTSGLLEAIRRRKGLEPISYT